MKQIYDAVKRAKRNNGITDDTDDDDNTGDEDSDNEDNFNNDDNVNTVSTVDIDDGANAETPGMLLEECRSRAAEEVIIEEFVYEFNGSVYGARLHVQQLRIKENSAMKRLSKQLQIKAMVGNCTVSV